MYDWKKIGSIGEDTLFEGEMEDFISEDNGVRDGCVKYQYRCKNAKQLVKSIILDFR